MLVAQGRVCGLTADDEGEFTTFPIIPAGRQLRINVRTHGSGSVRVEVLAVLGLAQEQFDIMTGLNTVGAVPVEGRCLSDCEPITGDHQNALVRWGDNSDLGIAHTDGVALRFSLRAADIFGFQWV